MYASRASAAVSAPVSPASSAASALRTAAAKRSTPFEIENRESRNAIWWREVQMNDSSINVGGSMRKNSGAVPFFLATVRRRFGPIFFNDVISPYYSA